MVVQIQNIIFFSAHNSKKDIFFLSEAVVHWYLLEAAARLLKNIEMFLEAATQSST